MSAAGKDHGDENGDDERGGGDEIGRGDTGGTEQFVAQWAKGIGSDANPDGRRQRGEITRLLGLRRRRRRRCFGGKSRVTDLVSELVHEDAVPERRLAHIGARTAVHREPVAVLMDDLHRTPGRPRLLGEERPKSLCVRAAYGHARAQPGPAEVGGLLVGDEPAPVERDDAVGVTGRLLGVVRGEQDRAALGGVRAQNAVQPAPLASGETVDGLVDDEGVRVAEKSAGETEAAIHAARERPQRLVTQAGESYPLEDLVRTPDGHARRAAQHAQLPTDRTRGMAGDVAEEYATSRCGWATRCSGRPRK